MGGARVPGPVGTDPESADRLPPDYWASENNEGVTIPGPIGGGDGEELSNVPTVKDVQRDWDVTQKNEKATSEGLGLTLAALRIDLDAKEKARKPNDPTVHWGEGGGILTMDKVSGIKAGQTFTVTLHGEFLCRLPTWKDRDSASAGAKTEWDRFIGQLKKHELQHVEIAKKFFDGFADSLPGTKITELDKKFQAAEPELKLKQKDHDDTTKNGADINALLDTTKG
jgi:hypothetical protein